MLTVKHMSTLGNEALYEAIEVTHSSNEASSSDGQHEPLIGAVFCRTPHDEHLIELRSGRVYVMNLHGSTVASYDLGGWPIASREVAKAA